MKNTRRFKWTALLMVLALGISLILTSAIAEEIITFPIVVNQAPLEDKLDQEPTITNQTTKTTVQDLSKEDPNNSFVLNLSIKEPQNASQEEALPENTNETVMTYKLNENMIAFEGKNNDVSWSYSSGLLIFKWISEKKTSFTANISIQPNYPDTFKLSGSYVLKTIGTNAVIGTETYTDAGRNKLKSYIGTEKNGMVYPMSDTDPFWVLTHVTGDYYTIKAADSGLYLAVKTSNNGLILENVEESKAQKFLVKAVNGGYAFVNSNKAVNNSNKNAEKGFACWDYSGGSNEVFKLYKPSEVGHDATEDKSGTWTVINANKKAILTARTAESGKLVAVETDNMNGILMPRDDVNTWTFEHVNRDWYNVQTEQGYLNIKNNGVFLSSTPQHLLLRWGNGTSTFTLATGNGASDYALSFTNGKFVSVINANNSDTQITQKGSNEVNLNKTEISGSWAITTATTGAALVGQTNGNKLVSVPYDEYNDGTIGSLEKDIAIWTFTKKEGNWYSVQSDAGYLSITNGAVTISSEEKLVYIQEANGKYRLTAGNQWALNNNNNKPSDGYNAYDKGYTQNTSEWQTLRKVTTDVKGRLIFDLNGGTNAEKPADMIENAGSEIVLPDTSAQKDGAAFIGWTTTKSFYTVNSGEKSTYHKLFRAGDPYNLQKGTNTLYAVYDTTSLNVRLGIRIDGVIQDEPNVYDSSAYKGHFWMYGVRNSATWVIDINAQKNVNGYYMENDVMAALTRVPTAEEIAKALMNEGKIVFNPETQYIHWYVLKYTGKEWHIDGVIREKKMVNITYDLNIEETNERVKVLNMPGGYEMASGTRILIGTNKNSQEVKTPTREGYVFKGWNTAADGNGTVYAEGSYKEMTENLHLYAQWEDVRDGQKVIKIISDWPEGKPAYAGTMITLTAVLTGYENLDYTLQWQYSDDERGNWHDVAGENNITMTFEMSETTASYYWRVIAVNVTKKQ